MNSARLLATFALLNMLAPPMVAAQETVWRPLPPLPDKEGFAAMFAGESGGHLLAAGGANFPGKKPWEGGTKIWYDTIWALSPPASTWVPAGKLPRPLGYGASTTWNDEVICAGGSDAKGHVSDVFALKLTKEGLAVRPLPALPLPCANMAWSLVGSQLFLAGGIEKPDATVAMSTFWKLNLQQPETGWLALPPCPGPARMLAVAGTWHGSFYLFGGASLQAAADGRPERIWRRDAWQYHPVKGWRALPDMPRVAVAAPSPAPATTHGLWVVSGDDGSKVGFKPETQHPGFPRTALLFNPVQETWHEAGTVPFSLATAPVSRWGHHTVIVSGEARPGYRTPQVWSLEHAAEGSD